MNTLFHSAHYPNAAKFLLFTVSLLLSFTASGKSPQKLDYPNTAQGDVVDTYFGVKVPDPYRWLEDDRSEETADWVARQNQLTFSYLEQIPYRDALKQRLSELWNYEKVSAPFSEGEYTYFYKNDGLQNHAVLYRQKADEEPEVFIDPNTFSEDGTTSLTQVAFSTDGSLATYSTSAGGSDWRTIYVMDAMTKKLIGEPITDAKFTTVSWRANEGFYYAAYDKPEGSELSAKTDQHKLYFHKIGQSQAEDKVVFGGSEEQKRRYVFGSVTEDDQYLVITATNSTSGNELYVQRLNDPEADLIVLQPHMDANTYFFDNRGDVFYLQTNVDAPNERVVKVDLAKPQSQHWVDVIPESDNVLRASAGGGFIFAQYTIDALSRVYQYDLSGKRIREVELPGLGTSSRINGKLSDTQLYYGFSNAVTPYNLYKFDVKSGQSKLYHQSGAKFDSSQYVSKQVFYQSKDGTRVPMMISHRKDTPLDGSAPTILYGYGGFNSIQSPRFSISRALWMEQGGIYVVANLRGGGEYGRSWHDAGRLMNKQNVFDDFIAAAEYLIKEKITSKKKLALQGGSNGGLLVGAVLTQRPDLFQVALPAVGVLDMLRYHTFTAGAGWAYDYGTSEQSKEMFDYLKSYSPLHNVKAGTEYPATLITTADHDDRVVPAHSFKFAAELQKKQAGSAPVLIRIDTKSGHGAGRSVAQSISLTTDIYSFTMHSMGVKSLPNLATAAE